MGVVQTSLLAYEGFVVSGGVGRFQRVVLEALVSVGRPVTDRELIEYCYLSDDFKPRSRRFELWKAGLVRRGVKRRCEVSGRLAYTWEVVLG